jgi:uncharacterized protein (DUF1501 family)
VAPFCFGPDAWAAISDEGPRRLIVILLRGAVDGLNVVIPYAEGAYYQERQSRSHRRASRTGHWRSTGISGCTRPSQA